MKKLNYKDNINGILEGKIKIKSNQTLKKYLIEYKIIPHICEKCGLKDIWENKSITLDLDHIDGNRNNNKKENLRFLCPNCHSQTKTFRGRNQNGKKRNIIKDNKEYIIKLAKSNITVKEILDKLNLSYGGNAKIIYEILKNNKINRPKKNSKSKLLVREEKELKIIEKLKKLQNNINKIKNSQINFNERGWGLEVSNILNITPQASLRWVKREMPEFYRNCWQHKK